MAGILENLNYIIEILEEDKVFFLQTRNQLQTESNKLETLRPTYMKFDDLYVRFRDNINDIIVANSQLKRMEQMHNQGQIMEDRFIVSNNQLNTKIMNSYTIITEDIFPKLQELATKINIDSAPVEKRKEFNKERDAEIKKTEEEIEGNGIVERLGPYLKQLFPILIKRAVFYATGVTL